MPRASYIGITVSMVLVTLVLAIWLPVASQDVHLNLRGHEVSFTLSGGALVAGILLALAATGMDAVTRPLFGPSGELGRRIPCWVLPGLLSVAGLVISRGLWWGYQLVALAATGLALTAVMAAQYHALSQGPRARPLARLTLQAFSYAVALVLFGKLYDAGLRGVLLGSGALLMSGGLALVLLQESGAGVPRVWLYAGVVGLSLGELMLALNYYRLDVRAAAALLLLVFYILTGLAQQQLWNRLTRRVALEYGAVATVGLLALYLFIRQLGV